MVKSRMMVDRDNSCETPEHATDPTLPQVCQLCSGRPKDLQDPTIRPGPAPGNRTADLQDRPEVTPREMVPVAMVKRSKDVMVSCNDVQRGAHKTNTQGVEEGCVAEVDGGVEGTLAGDRGT